MYDDEFYAMCYENADAYFNDILSDMGYVQEVTDEELRKRYNEHKDKFFNSARNFASSGAVYGVGHHLANPKNRYGMGTRMVGGGSKFFGGLGMMGTSIKGAYHGARAAVDGTRLKYRDWQRRRQHQNAVDNYVNNYSHQY